MGIKNPRGLSAPGDGRQEGSSTMRTNVLYHGNVCLTRGNLVVVPFAGGNLNDIPPDPVHQSVGVIDPAAPEAGKVAFQRLWFANALETSTLDVLQKSIDALDYFPVLRLPVEVVGPAPVGEQNVTHSPLPPAPP